MSINDILNKYENAATEETKEDSLNRLANTLADLMGEINSFLKTRTNDFKFSNKEFDEISNEITIKYAAECEHMDLMHISAEGCDYYLRRELHPQATSLIKSIWHNMLKPELEARKEEIKNNPNISAFCAYYKIENLEAKYRRYL